jgi:hypothetical protein
METAVYALLGLSAILSLWQFGFAAQSGAA